MKETYRNIKKVLIANRGEITARIQRTLHRMGIRSVVVYASDDAEFGYLKKADAAISLGEGNLHDTYLNTQKIIAAAKNSGADAIHPGYGFLSESDSFAREVMAAGLVWIGPDPEHIHLMGNKINARSFAKNCGVPVVDIWEGTPKQLASQTDIVYPVIAKPANGGGGKGMRLIANKKELLELVERTSAEAERYFGDGTVYLERYIAKARHIEVQVLGDAYGNAVHLFERECTVQRRYQKIIEEAPAANLSEKTRRQLHASALLLVKQTGYKNAGTVEYIVDEQENFYFLEMNTRIQVEHPVTEEITGIDLVEQQIHIAAGQPLKLRQENLSVNGHSIEVRLYAEDPFQNFMPSAGTLHAFHMPQTVARVETACAEGAVVSTGYDPMLAKLIVCEIDRETAIYEMNRVLKASTIHGLKTSMPLLRHILGHAQFKAAEIHTTWCDDVAAGLQEHLPRKKEEVALVLAGYLLAKSHAFSGEANPKSAASLWQSLGYWRNFCRMPVQVGKQPYLVEWRMEDDAVIHIKLGEFTCRFPYRKHNNRSFEVCLNDEWKTLFTSVMTSRNYCVSTAGFTVEVTENLKSFKTSKTKSKVNGLHSSIVSPLPGKVIKIHAPVGSHVKKGDALLIIESMKMENKVVAVSDSTIKKVCVVEGQQLEGSEVLLEVEHKTFSN